MRCPYSECASISMNGGAIPSQIPERVAWIKKQMKMTELDILDPQNHLVFLPGVVALKAKSTVIVFANMVETTTVNMIPNIICRRIQVAVLGRPMKSKEQRKHRKREMRRM